MVASKCYWLVLYKRRGEFDKRLEILELASKLGTFEVAIFVWQLFVFDYLNYYN